MSLYATAGYYANGYTNDVVSDYVNVGYYLNGYAVSSDIASTDILTITPLQPTVDAILSTDTIIIWTDFNDVATVLYGSNIQLAFLFKNRGDVKTIHIENIHSSVTDMQEFANGAINLQSITVSNPSITANITNMSTAWFGCEALTSFPLIDTSSVSNLSRAWSHCRLLSSFPQINTSNVTDMHGAWNGCLPLVTFPLIDTSSVTNFYQTWYNCNALISFPQINTSSATNLDWTWYSSDNLTDFLGTIDITSNPTLSNTFGNTNLTNFGGFSDCANANFDSTTFAGSPLAGYTCPPLTTDVITIAGFDTLTTVPLQPTITITMSFDKLNLTPFNPNILINTTQITPVINIDVTPFTHIVKATVATSYLNLTPFNPTVLLNTKFTTSLTNINLSQLVATINPTPYSNINITLFSPVVTIGVITTNSLDIINTTPLQPFINPTTYDVLTITSSTPHIEIELYYDIINITPVTPIIFTLMDIVITPYSPILNITTMYLIADRNILVTPNSDIITLYTLPLNINVTIITYSPILSIALNSTTVGIPICDTPPRVIKIGSVDVKPAMYWSGVYSQYIGAKLTTTQGDGLNFVVPLKKFTKRQEISTKRTMTTTLSVINAINDIITDEVVRITFNNANFIDVKFDLLNNPMQITPTHNGSDRYYLTLKVIE